MSNEEFAIRIAKLWTQYKMENQYQVGTKVPISAEKFLDWLVTLSTTAA